MRRTIYSLKTKSRAENSALLPKTRGGLMFIKKHTLVALLALAFGFGFALTMLGDDPQLAQSSTLEAIIARGEIVVASDLPFEPFEFLDDNGTLVGLDVDLVRLLAK